MVTTGFSDPLALLTEGQIDLAWIFYGWQGIQAEQMGIDLDVVMMEDYFDCVPDYYTPVVIASEATIADRPEVVEALLAGPVARLHVRGGAPGRGRGHPAAARCPNWTARSSRRARDGSPATT